jgi:hypothetical protein
VSSAVIEPEEPRRPMGAAKKVLVVLAGYAGAVVAATAAVALHVAATSGPDRQSASGMYAFGDSLLFLAAFSVAAIPATAAALFFLRSRPRFWRALAAVAALIAATALPAPVLYYAIRASWAGLSVLRVLVAPPLALLWFLSALLAPSRRPRLFLLSSAAIEVLVFASVAIRWLFAIAGR